MALEQKECPANCNPTDCETIFKFYAKKFHQCGGDETCEALIREEYNQALETCSVPSGA